jgi:hemolysin activation/secretion protein
MNANPDLTVNTKLKPNVRDGRRVIDAELLVEDNWPIHGSVELSNRGTSDSGDLRLRTTLQHNNLTRHGDILTAQWLTDPEGTDLNAYSASYYLPFTPKWTFNVFGGYSESDLDDVLSELNVRGEGWFVGTQFTRILHEDRDKKMQLSLGWMYQQIKEEDELAGFELDPRVVRLSMPMLTFGYASKRFDDFNGRFFFSNTVMYNMESAFGSSESDEFVRGDGDFLIDRFQLARYQRLFAGEEHPGKWSLFMKVDGQFSTEAVDASLQKSVGGATTVRGYEESELSGDDAIVATLELRTPLLQNFLPGLKKDEEYLSINPDAWQRHRLQMLFFCDYAWVSIDDSEFEDTGDGRKQNEAMLSVGAGLRLGLTKFSQMSLDWGFPLEEVEEHRDGGRGHFSVQLQF